MKFDAPKLHRRVFRPSFFQRPRLRTTSPSFKSLAIFLETTNLCPTMSFFSDTDDSSPPQPPSNRIPSAAASSFTDRLRSTISPALSHPPLGQPIPSSSSYDASGSGSRKEERAVSEFDEEAYYRELGIADDDEPEVPSTPTSNIFGSLSPARNLYGIPHDGAGRERVEAGFGMDLREGSATNWEEIDEEMEIEDMDDVRKMGLVWTRERGTTDIMPWEGELVDALLDKLEQQVTISLCFSIQQQLTIRW